MIRRDIDTTGYTVFLLMHGADLNIFCNLAYEMDTKIKTEWQFTAIYASKPRVQPQGNKATLL